MQLLFDRNKSSQREKLNDPLTPVIAVNSSCSRKKPLNKKKQEYFNDVLLSASIKGDVKKAVSAIEHGADVNSKGTVNFSHSHNFTSPFPRVALWCSGCLYWVIYYCV